MRSKRTTGRHGALKRKYCVQCDRKPARGDTGERADESGPPDCRKLTSGAAHEMTYGRVAAEKRFLGPPIQVAGVENILGGVNRERRAGENYLKSVVVKVAKNDVADR